MLGDTEIPGLLATALHEWESSRTHLSNAIRSYAGATAVLRAATTSYPLWTLRYPTSALEDELESLPLKVHELEKARVVLANTRNAQFSLVNRLPSELLSSIFQILVDRAYPRDIYATRSYANPADKLTQVCAHWRQVGLDNASLWSCIVFTYCRGTDRIVANTQLQLERSRGSPVDLLLYHRFLGADSFRLRPTLALLKPYMKQLRSLTVRLHKVENLESLLECCLTNGTAGSLSRLEILEEQKPLPLFYEAHSQTLARLNKYLQSVRILKLRGITVGWKCAAFEQLDELSIKDLPTSQCPNLTQFAEVISASPRLRSLHLDRMTIHEDTGPTFPSPLRLKHLKQIMLISLGDPSSCRALSVLSLEQQNLILTIFADFNSSTVLMALRRLAGEGCIEAFCFSDSSNDQPLQEILESLPDLTCLVVDETRLEQSHLDILVHHNRISPVSPSSPTAQINPAGTVPKLKKLTLNKCVIICNQEAFVKTVHSLSLDILRLIDCSIEVRTESQEGPGGVSTGLRKIDATTELSVRLTENMTGQLSFDWAIEF